MLGGERTVASPEENIPLPTYGQTFKASFEKPFQQVNQLGAYLFPGESTKEGRQKTAERLSYIDEITNTPGQGLTQRAGNEISNIAGGLIPTFPFIFGGEVIGGAAAGVIGFGARKVALEAATEYGTGALTAYTATQVPLRTLATGGLARFLPNFSLGKIGTELAKQYAGYKGLTLPEHFADNYNAVNDTFDSSHAIEEWNSDNYGFLLGGAPLAAGYIAYKGIRGVINLRKAHLNRRAIEAEHKRLLDEHKEILKHNEIKKGEAEAHAARASELQEHLGQAVQEGYITQKEHDWYLDYLENPNHPKVHEAGLDILKDLQIPYDRITGRVWNQVLSREGVNQFQGALFDQAITNFSKEENQLLSSYIIHNEFKGYLANLIDNPNMLNALKGMTHDLGLKIEEHKAQLRKFDEAITSQLSKRLPKKIIFSQKNIYQHLKDIGVRDIREVPYHVPKAVRQKLKLLERIEKIKSKTNKKLEREFNDGTLARLKNELNLMKTLRPAEELDYLKESLLPNGKLRNNYKNKNAYDRLEELSQVWPEARHLLNRIEMEAFNGKQEALNNVLKTFTEMVDSNAASLANPDNVKNYLHNRIQRQVPFTKRIEQSGLNIERQPDQIVAREKENLNPDTLYDESNNQIVKNTDLEEARTRFEESEKRFRQLKENEGALSELIKCALGE